MKLYKIEVDLKCSSDLNSGNKSEYLLSDILWVENSSIDIEKLNARKFYIDTKNFPESNPDSDFYGILNYIVFDKKVYDSPLLPILKNSGQIIALDMSHDPVYSDKQLWLYICNTKIDCLDKERSGIDYYECAPSDIKRINSYSLYSSNLTNSTLFNIPEELKGPLFCVSNPDSPETDFYKIYTDNNFTGLKFTECELS